MEKGASLSQKPAKQINDAAELRVSAPLKVGGESIFVKKKKSVFHYLENVGLWLSVADLLKMCDQDDC